MQSLKSTMHQLPQRYDRTQSYQWNYDHAPTLPNEYLPAQEMGSVTICGLSANSPLGIAAGPLLNGRWLLHYAALGFDVLTYKTVRSRPWPCYERPNLQPVKPTVLTAAAEVPLVAADEMSGSWAVSFGMPSQSPEVWRRDVETARNLLPAGKLLSVSVVAAPESGWTVDDLAQDYARCAMWAHESGADMIELNFSCPNVTSCDGQFYQNPTDAGHIAQVVRNHIGDTPLLIKVGHVADRRDAEQLVAAVSPAVDALVMVNCLAARVTDNRTMLFSGGQRGIAGAAIREASLEQVSMFHEVISTSNHPLQILGVGGVKTAGDVRAHLASGACAVQMATAAMLDPLIALKIRDRWNEQATSES